MSDDRTVAQELEEARLARLAAEDAWCEVEELLWKARRGPRFWRHIAAEASDETFAPPRH